MSTKSDPLNIFFLKRFCWYHSTLKRFSSIEKWVRKAWSLRAGAYRCPRKVFNRGILLSGGRKAERVSEFSWKFWGQFSSQDESRELCVGLRRQGWLRAGRRTIAPSNLSGYHQPPQSVKRQLQALFCARPDCQHSRNHRHGFCVSSSSAFSCTDTCTTFKGLQKAETFSWRIF